MNHVEPQPSLNQALRRRFSVGRRGYKDGASVLGGPDAMAAHYMRLARREGLLAACTLNEIYSAWAWMAASAAPPAPQPAPRRP